MNPDAVISDLSVGEQQRVEILKALYRNVELLILDEPTGVLTPQETTQFFDVLRNLKKEGYGIIIITHRMSEIMAISDKVIHSSGWQTGGRSCDCRHQSGRAVCLYDRTRAE